MSEMANTAKDPRVALFTVRTAREAAQDRRIAEHPAAVKRGLALRL